MGVGPNVWNNLWHALGGGGTHEYHDFDTEVVHFKHGHGGIYPEGYTSLAISISTIPAKLMPLPPPSPLSVAEVAISQHRRRPSENRLGNIYPHFL